MSLAGEVRCDDADRWYYYVRSEGINSLPGVWRGLHGAFIGTCNLIHSKFWINYCGEIIPTLSLSTGGRSYYLISHLLAILVLLFCQLIFFSTEIGRLPIYVITYLGNDEINFPCLIPYLVRALIRSSTRTTTDEHDSRFLHTDPLKVSDFLYFWLRPTATLPEGSFSIPLNWSWSRLCLFLRLQDWCQIRDLWKGKPFHTEAWAAPEDLVHAPKASPTWLVSVCFFHFHWAGLELEKHRIHFLIRDWSSPWDLGAPSRSLSNSAGIRNCSFRL